MKITVLPESFRHELNGGTQTKKVELDILVNAEEFGRYIDIKKNLIKKIQEDKGELCDDHGATVLHLNYADSKSELSTEETIQKIASHFQEFKIINETQCTALKEASKFFISMRESNHTFNGFTLELTAKGVELTLAGKRDHHLPGVEPFSYAVTLTHTIPYKKVKSEHTAEVQPSVYRAPGFSSVGC